MWRSIQTNPLRNAGQVTSSRKISDILILRMPETQFSILLKRPAGFENSKGKYCCSSMRFYPGVLNLSSFSPERSGENYQCRIKLQPSGQHAETESPFGQRGKMPVMFRGPYIAESRPDIKHAGGNRAHRGENIDPCGR